MCLSMTYTPYVTYPKEQTGNIITFTQSEEGILVYETWYNAERGDEYDDD